VMPVKIISTHALTKNAGPAATIPKKSVISLAFLVEAHGSRQSASPDAERQGRADGPGPMTMVTAREAV
jgi:hypothetical protein